MEWLDEFPTMERQGLRDLKKAIDLGFRDFSRAYGDGIEGFFEPLLYFLVWLDKLLVNTPWPVIIVGLAALAWIGSRSWFVVQERSPASWSSVISECGKIRWRPWPSSQWPHYFVSR